MKNFSILELLSCKMFFKKLLKLKVIPETLPIAWESKLTPPKKKTEEPLVFSVSKFMIVYNLNKISTFFWLQNMERVKVVT